MLYFIILAFLISTSQAKVEELEPGEEYTYNMHKGGEYCLSVNVTGEENKVHISIKVNGITLTNYDYHNFNNCFNLNNEDFGVINILNNIDNSVYIQETLTYTDTELEKKLEWEKIKELEREKEREREREKERYKFKNVEVITFGCFILFLTLCIVGCFSYFMTGFCTELLKLISITRKNYKPVEKEIELKV